MRFKPSRTNIRTSTTARTSTSARTAAAARAGQLADEESALAEGTLAVAGVALAETATRRRKATQTADGEAADDVAGRDGENGHHSWLWRAHHDMVLGLSKVSPLLASAAADGAYLRGLLGPLALLLPAIGVLLGGWVGFTGSVALGPPSVLVFGGLLIVGTLDALAGALALVAMLLGALLVGHLPTLGSLLAGVIMAGVWFGISIMITRLRPILRPINRSIGALWLRAADLLIASLFSGFLVAKIIGAIPMVTSGGTALADHASQLGVLAGAIVLVKYLAVTLLTSARGDQAQAWTYDQVPDPEPRFRYVGHTIEVTIVVLLLSRFIGWSWLLVPLAILYLVDLLIPWIAPPRELGRWAAYLVPRGGAKVTVMCIAAAGVTLWLSAANYSGKTQLIVISFFVMALSLPITWLNTMEIAKVPNTLVRYGGGVLIVVVTALQLSGHLVA